MQSQAIEILQTIMQWVVAPIAGFVWLLHNQVQNQKTAIAVLQAESLTNKQAHDREMKEIRDTMERIFQKLNSIEEALRK